MQEKTQKCTAQKEYVYSIWGRFQKAPCSITLTIVEEVTHSLKLKQISCGHHFDQSLVYIKAHIYSRSNMIIAQCDFGNPISTARKPTLPDTEPVLVAHSVDRNPN